MWDCEHCGCLNIAGDIPACPMCHKPRETSAVVPTAVEETVSAEGEAVPGASSPESGDTTPPQASSTEKARVKKEAW
jgi:hypothetical protein